MPRFEVPVALVPAYRDALGFVMAMAGGGRPEDIQSLIDPYLSRAGFGPALLCSALARLFFHAVECLVESDPETTSAIDLMREMSIQIGIREGGPVDEF